jgi:hypothetical protein
MGLISPQKIGRSDVFEPLENFFLWEHRVPVNHRQELRYPGQIVAILKRILELLRPLVGDLGAQGENPVVDASPKEGGAFAVLNSPQ